MVKSKDRDEHPRHGGDGSREEREGGWDREVHLAIIARHMQGSVQPTPLLRARALEQWAKLPGSVVQPPTDLRVVETALALEASEAAQPSTGGGGQEGGGT